MIQRNIFINNQKFLINGEVFSYAESERSFKEQSKTAVDDYAGGFGI
jgi:hypothetical protein